MNPLDIVLAGLFEMLGFNGGRSPDAPKLDGSERFDAKGQTKMTNAKGNLRDFTSPRQSANRMPSLDPLTNRSNLQAIPPNRPPGGFGQSPGQLNLYGQTSTPALPPAGQTGGSLPPSGTTVPTTSRPRAQQGPQTRQQYAQNKLADAAKGTRGSNVITPKAGAATAAEARGEALKQAARRGGGAIADIGGPALQVLDAIFSFQGAKDRGATNEQAVRTTAGSLAGGAAGFRLGMQVPVNDPRVKFASALILGLVGQTLGEGALEGIQGYNNGETTKAEPKAETKPEAAKPETKTEAPKAAPETKYPATGRLLDTPELRQQLARELMMETPVQRPLTNPNKAPIRAQLRSRPNLGLEQVTPRDALRPDLYAY